MNTNLLRYYMAEAGYKVGDMGAVLGVTDATYSNKINGKTEFTVSEASRLAKLLNLDAETAVKVFFD